MLVRDIYNFMDEYAPFNTAEEFDNCGLILGDMDAKVEKIGMALDLTTDIVDKAVKAGINLIITHHPPIFDSIKRIVKPSVIADVLENKISVISAHTNLDKCRGGVNDVLAKYYELEDVVDPIEIRSLCRVGTLKQDLSVEEYAVKIKNNLKVSAAKYYDSGVKPKKVAYISGGGASMFTDVQKLGVDTFITGDIKLDIYVTAQNVGVNIIEVGHFDSENVIFTALSDEIKKIYKEADITLLSKENAVKYV